jgi:glyoxylase-like metal-dependent hydrolase (beta-lactamase superfamily II)
MMIFPSDNLEQLVTEVAEKTWYLSLLAGITVFETDDGLVMVDTGLRNFSQHMAKELRNYTSAPVHTVIYTHGHVDHAFGLDAFLLEGQQPPRVIAHRAIQGRFLRYSRTPKLQRTINARQFFGATDDLLQPDQQAVLDIAFQKPHWQPDILYDNQLTFGVGRLTFELHHARGETDDHTWVFCPQLGVLCPGDLLISVVPNAGNPQKVQRYPWDWAQALREMAGLQPSTVCPGHGRPIVDNRELIQSILLETADFLDSIVEQTISMLENGSPPHVDIVRSIVIPTSDSPWLQPLYDEAEFIARNVIRYYEGWFSGRPSELKPAPRSAVAKEIARLAGGASALATRADALASTGNLPLSCHLADYALEAAPEDSRVKEIVARIYESRAASETSVMAINLFRSASAYAKAGRPFA